MPRYGDDMDGREEDGVEEEAPTAAGRAVDVAAADAFATKVAVGTALADDIIIKRFRRRTRRSSGTKGTKGAPFKCVGGFVDMHRSTSNVFAYTVVPASAQMGGSFHFNNQPMYR